MKVNKAGVDLVKEFEGFEAEAYVCPAGKLTIGYGITADAGIGVVPVMGMRVTQAEAERHLQLALDKFGAAIRPMLTVEPNENEWSAMVSLAYNIGPTAFSKSSVRRFFNAGDKARAADAFLMWNKATVNGKRQVLRGLTRRREAERALFLASVTKPVTPSPWAALIAAILSIFRKVKA